MKFLLVIGLSLALWGCEKRIKKTQYFPDNTPKKVWHLTKSSSGKYLKDGPQQSWYPSGKLESEFNYAMGQMDGPAQTWYANGQIQFEGVYHNGFLISESQWDAQGKLLFNRAYKVVANYHSDVEEVGPNSLREKYTVYLNNQQSQIKHGHYRSFFPNQQLKFLGEFADGRRHGFTKEWYDNGVLRAEGHYLEGKKEGPWKYWHKNGKIQSSIMYRHDKKDGPFRMWYPSGQIQEMSEYVNDTLNASFKSWFANGNPKEEKRYQMGLLTEGSKSWYPNGQMEQFIHWRKGKAHGMLKEWFESGQIRIETNYNMGNLEGSFKKWYPNGNLFMAQEYKHGLQDGQASWHSENGNLISNQIYKDGKLVMDSQLEKVKSYMEAEQADIPLEFMGFVWSMKEPEIRANITRLQGNVTNALDNSLTFILPAQQGNQTTQIKGRAYLNGWGELWKLSLDFPNKDAVKFSEFASFIEKELKYKLGLPKFSKRFKNLPGMLEKQRRWGKILSEPVQPSLPSKDFPVVQADIFSYENQDWVSLELQNFLVREYAKQNEVVLSGPFYDATLPYKFSKRHSRN